MSQDMQIAVGQKTQQLLDGPLKHIRGAALAAALLPLASVAAAPAAAQTCAPSGGLCGLVFNDTNHNGIQDAGETGIPNAVVTINAGVDANGKPIEYVLGTNGDGVYELLLPSGTYTIEVQIPNDTEP